MHFFAGVALEVIVRMQPKIPCTGFRIRVAAVPPLPQSLPMSYSAQLQER